MKKKTPYIDFYNECMETGFMPQPGLCNCLGYNTIEIFKPTTKEYGAPVSSFTVWGYSGEPYTNIEINTAYPFTTFRQTIVLFLAAMNSEL